MPTDLTYTFDGNGSVIGLVDMATGVKSATYDCNAFGETVQSDGVASAANHFRFSTKYTDDETGMIYYGLRYYNPPTGRWLSREPLGESGSRNLYNIVSNNLANNIDVLGLYEEAGHFWTTYIVADAAGLSPDESFKLAYYSQLPDEFKPFDAKNAYFAYKYDGEARQLIKDYRSLYSDQYARKIQELLHSIHGGNLNEVMNRRNCLAKLIKQGDLKPWGKGMLIHALGDSYAHVDDDGTAYAFPNGHRDDSIIDIITGGKSESDPDLIADNQARYSNYVRNLYGSLAGENADPAKIDALLRTVKNIPHAGSEANSFMLKYAYNNSKYSKNAHSNYNPNWSDNVLGDSNFKTPSSSELSSLFDKIKNACCIVPK